jgi:phytoene/squalene synthetase
MSKAKATRAKSAAQSRANQRAAIRALEIVAHREAVGAFYAVGRALQESAEMKSPALARSRSGTVTRILREAFAYATGGHPSKRKFIRKSAEAPPFPHYLRLPIN